MKARIYYSREVKKWVLRYYTSKEMKFFVADNWFQICELARIYVR